MKISRELAIKILKYCFEHPKFYFPFLVMCQEYTPEDDDFVEIEADEWENIQEDEMYQTFELWENLQNLESDTTELLAKGFIEKITNEYLENEIRLLCEYYGKLYKENLTESAKILEYGENEFFGGKKEAFEDILELFKKYK
ncbi:hypothetical protein HGA92_04365 [Candidatus Gracilibacteria bacterium]|nr:hypothetical protein [Candidatus Gracilibacteria bacterium]NUJ98531.1 hypothetical protein [Candidatus Gracilibacteria bacterium]